MANAREFGKALDAAAEKAVLQLVEAQKTVSIAALQMLSTDSRRVSLRHGSPVWTGRFRASMSLSIGAPMPNNKPPHPDTVGPGAIRWPDEPDKVYNAPPLSDASVKLAALEPFTPVFITNALPYARRLELGHSKLKAPAGVFKVTAVALAARFKNLNLTLTSR